jgi:hypothetical protein
VNLNADNDAIARKLVGSHVNRKLLLSAIRHRLAGSEWYRSWEMFGAD